MAIVAKKANATRQDHLNIRFDDPILNIINKYIRKFMTDVEENGEKLQKDF